MKKYRIVERHHDIDFYNDKSSNDFIIQKKGWFGWKTLVERYGMYGLDYLIWSYFSEPCRNNRYDTFESRESCVLFLETNYGTSTSQRKVGDEITL